MAQASELIDRRIRELADWRGEMFASLRKLIDEADPSLTEDWKWSTAVWTSGGLVCAVGAFADHLKVNFFRGAELADPQGILNAGLDAKKTRAIDLRKGDVVDTAALSDLIRAAVALNGARP